MEQTITVTNAVEHFTHILAQALQFDFERYVRNIHKRAIANGEAVEYHQQRLDEIDKNPSFSNSTIFVVIEANKYYRIEQHDNQKSIVAFVDKTTGDVFKPASWKGPAPDARYNLLDPESREECIMNADWAGSFLYKK